MECKLSSLLARAVATDWGGGKPLSDGSYGTASFQAGYMAISFLVNHLSCIALRGSYCSVLTLVRDPFSDVYLNGL